MDSGTRLHSPGNRGRLAPGGGRPSDCCVAAGAFVSSPVDDVGFLRAVVGRASEVGGGDLAGIFAVGYSNGGHLVFRLALETPDDFDAFVAIGANLPVPNECDCSASNTPVSLLLVDGTEDPINAWAGGEVRVPGSASLGRVLSAEATARNFLALAGSPDQPAVE